MFETPKGRVRTHRKFWTDLKHTLQISNDNYSNARAIIYHSIAPKTTTKPRSSCGKPAECSHTTRIGGGPSASTFCRRCWNIVLSYPLTGSSSNTTVSMRRSSSAESTFRQPTSFRNSCVAIDLPQREKDNSTMMEARRQLHICS